MAAIALSIIMKDDHIPAIPDRPPAPVKDFIGCGFMVRRELFLSLGGFESRLYFYHEEPEYCFRTFQRGYETYAYPAVVIRHNKTPVARGKQPADLLFHAQYRPARSLVLSPSQSLGYGRLAMGPSPICEMPQLREHWWPLLRGWAAGFFCYLSWKKSEKRLTAEQFTEREKLPQALHLCMGSNTPM